MGDFPYRGMSKALLQTEVAGKEALKQINTKNSDKSIWLGSMHPEEIKHGAAISCGM